MKYGLALLALLSFTKMGVAAEPWECRLSPFAAYDKRFGSWFVLSIDEKGTFSAFAPDGALGFEGIFQWSGNWATDGVQIGMIGPAVMGDGETVEIRTFSGRLENGVMSFIVPKLRGRERPLTGSERFVLNRRGEATGVRVKAMVECHRIKENP